MFPMSRLDALRREATAYLSELEAERDRVQTFLTSLRPVLDEPDAVTREPKTTTPKASRSATRDGTPRTGGDAGRALLLMSQRADVAEWDTPSLLAALQADGWATDARSEENAVSAILSRLARAGQIKRRRRGRYAVPRPANADSPTEAVGLSDELDLTPEGGEYTDGQGRHHDHRIDFDGRNGDRDHLGAPVGR